MKAIPPVPSRDQITQAQVGTVLSAVATMIPLLHLRHNEDATNRLDGGTLMAVETTLCNALDRLDKILTDESRWGIEGTCRLENYLAQVYHEHAKTLKLQQQQIYELNRPHVRHSPQLARMIDGTWLAFLGDLDDINNAVVGVGGCPQQALEAFDEMFNGRVPLHLQAWIAIREEAIQNGLKPPTKKEYDQKHQSMDGGRNQGSQANEGGGAESRENSGSAGPDEDSGGPQGGPSAAI